MLRIVHTERDLFPQPVHPGHPSKDQLESFMRAELPRPQMAFVVRHLLTQCQQCVKVTRPLWALMEQEPKRSGGRR